MDSKLLQGLGKIAGLGGIAVGVVLLLFRDFLKQKFLPSQGLPPEQGYQILLAFLILTFGIGAVGVVAWIIGKTVSPGKSASLPALIVLTLLIAAVLASTVVVSRGDSSNSTRKQVYIGGRVEDSVTYEPIRGAMVSVAGYANPTPTEANGNFYLTFQPRQPSDPVRLHVDKEGYESGDETVVPPIDSAQVLLKRAADR